jgi:endonuclease/exonuclease/phosphatase family metal-dependent hydrolase
MALLLAACAYRMPAGTPSDLSCLRGDPAVTWRRAEPDRRLDWWCARVGPPVVRDLAPPVSDAVSRLLIVSWNVHVGSARVSEFVEQLRSQDDAAGGGTGIVLLLQEAFRSGSDVPLASFSGAVPDRIRPPEDAMDVEALGRHLRMSVAYVPSMRNGDLLDAREDRGTAVLSTEPLGDVAAIELPFGRQRRVATSALVRPRGRRALRMISAHFDSVLRVGGQRRQAAALAAQLASLGAAGEPTVLAIDTNARLGRHDRTVETIARVLPLVPCRPGPAPLRLLETDFVFTNLDAARVVSCAVERRDFGSDHRPLVMMLTVTE